LRHPFAYVIAAALVVSACGSRGGSAPETQLGPRSDCSDFSFPIYFETNSARLTDAGAQLVREAAERVRGCALGRIDVVGLADVGGTDARNLAVSRERAEAVADALARAGLPRPAFDIDAAGTLGAATPDGRPEPVRRRTEVVIRAAPPTGR